MDHQIDGVIAQTLSLTFRRGETCWASKRAIISIGSDVTWNLRVPGGAGGALRRELSGEGIALNYLEGTRDGARVTLGANEAGRIVPWDLDSEGPVTASRGAFVAAAGEIDITVTVARRAGAVFFGGAGLFLQKISGHGVVFLHGAGDFLERRLQEGEELRVSTGNLAAFSASVDYRIRSVGSFRKMFFSGEGIFMTELAGPGRVLLQSLKRRLGRTSSG